MSKGITQFDDGHANRIRELKMRFTRGRDEARKLHQPSRDPRTVSDTLTSLCDRTIEQVHRLAIADADPRDRSTIIQHISLVAVGGYGRRDLAPYSDVDLLFLTTQPDAPAIRAFTSRMVRDLWDAGLELAHSIRTVSGCLALAREDLTIRTALAEARLLVGGVAMFADLQHRLFRLLASLPLSRFVSEITSARAREHQDYHAQTVFLLEPNVKKSPGGLRDYHTLRWLAAARYGIREIEELRAGGLLNEADATTVLRARDVLQRIRHELHFHATGAQDVLTREEQIHLAQWLGFTDEGPLLGVERFMQHYYLHTRALNEVLARFIEGMNQPGWFRHTIDRLYTIKADTHFLMNRRTIGIAKGHESSVLGSVEQCLHLLDCARKYDVAVEYGVMELLRAGCANSRVSRDDRQRFLDLLGNPGGIGNLLRNLGRIGLLGRVLPPFEHARCLIQFNVQHKYTVDEHSLRAVEAAAARLGDRGPLGCAYRAIRRKDILHLAILLHDLGKGLGDDHCAIGRQLAEQTAADFGLNEHEQQLLCELVGQHLLMAHTAFRRDLSDEATVVQFARSIATPEMLRMLYVMTAADTQAVSPENWTAWKESLLNELYLRTMEVLTGEAILGDEQTRALAIRQELTGMLDQAFETKWLVQQLEQMPLSYLQTRPLTGIRRDLEILTNLGDKAVHVDSEYLPGTEFVEYTVFARDNLVEGLFSKIAGVLAASGIQIVTARIVTRPDNVVIDTFVGQDLTFTGEPPRSRREEVADLIVRALSGRLDVEQLLARRIESPTLSRRTIPAIPPRVEIDIDSSNRFTIVEVFAEDRLGRLYTITRTLFELGLSVWSAKISTHADQIVDAFYVTTRAGSRIDNHDQLAEIRASLEAILAEHG